MDAVTHLSDFLHVHSDRDKIVCLASYVLKLWGANTKDQRLLSASARLGSARATLRLFDDALAIKNLFAYGLGKHEGPLWGTLGVAATSSYFLYLQTEKLVWLADCGLITLPKEWDRQARIAHKLLWVIMSAVGFVRSLRGLKTASQELNSPTPRKCAHARFNQASLLTTKMMFDIIHSVSWLPEGWLWGGRLSASKMGSVATVSAVIALIMQFQSKRLASK